MELIESGTSTIGFRKHIIDDRFQSEGTTIADMNNDGRPDLVAGSYWWQGPGWKRHSFRSIADVGSPSVDLTYYKDETYNFADDLDGDGDADILTVHAPGQPVRWYENPGGQGEGRWKSHVVCPGGPSESVVYRDLDGDGKKDFVTTSPASEVSFYTRGADPTKPWTKHVIGPVAGDMHGLGVGDVNDDGRLDVLVNRGWYQGPEDPHTGKWTFHSLAWLTGFFLADCFDIDGDGDTDFISTSPHKYGIWWWEKSRTSNGLLHFRKHTINDTISQNHSRALADLDGDGVLDYVTGKRFYAANGGDPGAYEPAIFAWYQARRNGGEIEWVQHLIDTDAGPGLDFEIADTDNDGDLDIFIAGKKGCILYEQVPREELYRPLFNGQDLTGWVGDTKHWSVRDGMIVGTQDGSIKHNVFLFSKKTYGDFELVLQCRMVGGVGNSGIQFRSERLADGEAKGYQADLGDGWWGSLYDERGRGVLVKNEKIDPLDRSGWLAYRIRAVGPHIRLYLDGIQTIDFVDPEGAREGRFALQLHTGPAMTMQFKDIRIWENPPEVSRVVVRGKRVPAWWVSGPFPNDEGEDEGFDYANPPEAGFEKNLAMLGKGEKLVRWNRMNANDAGYVELMPLIGQYSSAYAFTYLISPEAQHALFQMGSDDGIRVWLNDALVHSHNVDRGAAPEQDQAHVRLKKGVNRLLVKIVQNGGGAGFYFHISGKERIAFQLEP